MKAAVSEGRHGFREAPVVIFAKGYGLADIENNVPVTKDTVFQTGSVGKQLTAAGVLLLVQVLTPDERRHWQAGSCWESPWRFAEDRQ